MVSYLGKQWLQNLAREGVMGLKAIFPQNLSGKTIKKIKNKKTHVFLSFLLALLISLILSYQHSGGQGMGMDISC